MSEKNTMSSASALNEKKQRSLWQEAWRRFRKNRMAMIGLAFISFLVIISIATLVIDAATHNAIYNEYVVKQDLVNRLKGPSARHIFGQDEFGRDMLLRMIWGTRYSLFTGGIAIVLALIAGGMLGAVSGYYGGVTDTIILQYIIPNALAPIIVQATLGLAGAILSIAGLSFLGLGIQPPTPEWGAMLSNARVYIRDAWHVTLIPGFGIMLTILSLNLMGDGLRDAMDPKLKN